MWRWYLISALVLSSVTAEPHHDGTDHHHHEELATETADDKKVLVMLEIEPLKGNVTETKDKRSPQSSQAVYGASPGQFVVRTAPQAAAPEIPPEYQSILQQLVAQQAHEQAAGAQQIPTPVIQQLLVSRNPNPSAVQFTGAPGTQQIPRRRPQDEPGAQLQQIYFNRQFQQQIPIRPRYLRPPPQQRTLAQATGGLPASVSASPQAHNVHDARLRASLAGENPNLLQQQVVFALPNQSPEAAYQQQQQLFQQPQEQVSYVQQAAPATQRPAVPQRQQQTIQQQPPEQYLRETTQQQSSDPSVYIPQQQSDEDLLSQILATKNDRGLFRGPSTPAPVVSSTTAVPATPSRSSIYVSQTTSNHRDSSSGVTVQEEVSQVGAGDTLPIVHLPTPKGQRPLTQSEFQALIDAGFNLTPVEVPSQQQVAAYYPTATTPKRQRSYATQAPPARNQLQKIRKPAPEEVKQQEVRYTTPGELSKQQEVRYTIPDVIPKQQVRYTTPDAQPKQQVRYTTPDAQHKQQEIRYTTSDVIPQVRYQQPQPQQQQAEEEEVRIQFARPGSRGSQYSSFRYEAAPAPQKPAQSVQYVQIPARRPLARYPAEDAEQQVQAYQQEQQVQAYQQEQQQQQVYQAQEAGESHNFQPIVVADLPSTTANPQAHLPRRRRPRPPQSRVVYHSQPDVENQRQEQPSGQYLVSYEAVPDTTYGSRKARQRSRRPSPAPES